MKLKLVKLICRVLLAIAIVYLFLAGFLQMKLYLWIAIGWMVLYSAMTLTLWKCPVCGKKLGKLSNKVCEYCKMPVNLNEKVSLKKENDER